MRKVIQALKNHKKLTIILYAVAFLGLFLTFSSHAVFAETVDYNVNVNPSLKISLSSNPIVLNLNPNSKPFGTANVDITVGTNNMYGYKLFMTTDSNTTDLVRDNSADSVAATIPTLTNTGNPCTTSYNNSTFTTNSWGYRINNNVGGETNCIDTTNTNYYSYTPGTLISSATTATNEQTATLTFASKIDYLKPAGQYALTLKMSALPIVTTYYMQDIAADPTLASTVCTEEPTVVLDKRDEQSYTIRRINGDCWMVENLKFVGTELTPETSNVAVNTTLNYGDLTDGDSYDEPRIHVGTIPSGMSPIDTSTTAQANIPTVWYNYAAASAGTIVGRNNTDPQIYDVCPAGWRLPNDSEIDTIVDNISQFNLTTGGVYSGGAKLYAEETGRWWGSNVGFMTNVDELRARSMLRYFTPDSPDISRRPQYRYFGMYIRCIMKPTDINNLTYMQDFATLNQSGNIAKKTQVINSMSEDQSYQLKDIRENGANSYYVAKLKDDNVWMVQNLKLGNASTSLPLTSTDSNVPSGGFTLNGKLSDGKFPPCDGASICDSSRYYCTSNYGCYYNWYTATGSSGSSATTSGDVNYSICPSGWTLPTQTQFVALNTAYSGSATALLVSPTSLTENTNGNQNPGFLLGGLYSSGGEVKVGSRGYYWARTAQSAQAGYLLFLDASTVNPVDYGSLFIGSAIRCLVSN